MHVIGAVVDAASWKASNDLYPKKVLYARARVWIEVCQLFFCLCMYLLMNIFV